MAIEFLKKAVKTPQSGEKETVRIVQEMLQAIESAGEKKVMEYTKTCLLYTSPSPRDRQKSRMPSSA